LPCTSHSETLQSDEAEITISLSLRSQISNVLIISWCGWNWVLKAGNTIDTCTVQLSYLDQPRDYQKVVFIANPS